MKGIYKNMKIIKNKKLYDTETSSMLGELWNGYTGLKCYSETLYYKQNGEYWLHIIGGAMTSLARPTGINGLTGGEKIVSLTREEARQWCEHNLDAETYISIWGTPEE